MGDNNLIIILFFLTTGEQIFGIKCVNATYNTAQWTGTSEGFISITALTVANEHETTRSTTFKIM